MTVVRIKCIRCTTTSMPELDALLLEVGADPGEGTGAIVNWICAGCSSLVNCAIDWPDFLDLVSAGAHVIDEEEDPLPPYPESAKAGPAWRPDDLLDLHALLLTHDWFDKLRATTGPAGDSG
ncbi:MAG: hypothetical protein QOJ11_1246 [Frankiales bacterium]|nr:hypothetical protein [Frankiales bacterium]